MDSKNTHPSLNEDAQRWDAGDVKRSPWAEWARPCTWPGAPTPRSSLLLTAAAAVAATGPGRPRSVPCQGLRASGLAWQKGSRCKTSCCWSRLQATSTAGAATRVPQPRHANRPAWAAAGSCLWVQASARGGCRQLQCRGGTRARQKICSTVGAGARPHWTGARAGGPGSAADSSGTLWRQRVPPAEVAAPRSDQAAAHGRLVVQRGRPGLAAPSRDERSIPICRRLPHPVDRQ